MLKYKIPQIVTLIQSLGVSIKAEQWDFKANQPKAKCPNRERITILINEKITEIQKAALDKRTLCKGIGSEYFQGVNVKT